ncbi:MAG TPA: PQQ-binding-like beta-propeller repeat protein [Ktedonobacterales bacterium]|nr:PQQ-binding-like beta-propeller repeat protein [Ktedonobacterales bacterium]
MQDNDFSPDTIDAQTGQDTANLPADDARLVYDLHRLHQPAAAKNAASLTRVQARLREREQRALKRPLAQPPTARLTYIKEQQMLSDTPSTRSGHIWRRLSVIAASLLLVVLVGSMAILFTHAHQGKRPSSANNHPPAATEPPDPAPARGLYLFIGSDSGAQISKLDPQTRQPLWTKDAGSAEGPLVVYGDTLYALDSTGDYPDETFGITAFSAQDGTLLWHSYFSQDSFRAPNGTGPYDLGVLSQPIVTHGMVYTLARDGKLYALDAATGKQLWSYTAAATVFLDQPVTWPDGTVEHNYGLSDAPSVSYNNGIVYGAIHNALFAVDAKTGKQLWTTKIDQTLLFNSPVSANGMLYLTSREESHYSYPESQQGYAYAYNPQNGALVWRHTVGDWVLSPPTVVKGIVYFGSYDDHLYALKASDGSQLWSYDTGGHISDQPLVSDGVIYIDEQGNGVGDNASTAQPMLFAINTSGKRVWSEEIPNLLFLQDVQNGQIYAAIFPGILTIFSTQDGSQIWSKVYNQERDKYGNLVGSPPLITLIE